MSDKLQFVDERHRRHGVSTTRVSGWVKRSRPGWIHPLTQVVLTSLDASKSVGQREQVKVRVRSDSAIKLLTPLADNSADDRSTNCAQQDDGHIDLGNNRISQT